MNYKKRYCITVSMPTHIKLTCHGFCVPFKHANVIPVDITHLGLHACNRNTRGGGVLIAISKSIPTNLNSFPQPVLRWNVILIPKLVVCCVYVPPNSADDYQCSLLSYLEKLPRDSDLVLLGDFNAPDVEWSSFIANLPF